MPHISKRPFWQEIARAGTYRLADGKKLTLTTGDLSNMADQGNAMLEAGLRVPFAWQHPPDAAPTYEHKHPTEWVAKGYFGEPKKFKVAGDMVLGLLTVADKKDYDQFAKVKTVSPRVMKDWVDEKGKKWSGFTISHVAATPKPVSREQTQANLSQVPAGAYDFSSEDRVDEKDKENKGEKSEETGGDSKDYGNAKSSDAPPTPGGKGEGESSKPIKGLQRIVNLIEKCGLKLGPNVMDEDDLCGRMEALAANLPGADGDPDEMPYKVGDEDDDNNLQPAESGAGPMLMSQLPEGAKKVVQGVVARVRKDMLVEVDGFVKAGKITPAIAQKHMDELKVADLSFAESGELVPIACVVRHQTYRDLIEQSAFRPKQGQADLSNLEEAALNKSLDPSAVEDEERAALEYAASIGGFKIKPKN